MAPVIHHHYPVVAGAHGIWSLQHLEGPMFLTPGWQPGRMSSQEIRWGVSCVFTDMPTTEGLFTIPFRCGLALSMYVEKLLPSTFPATTGREVKLD